MCVDDIMDLVVPVRFVSLVRLRVWSIRWKVRPKDMQLTDGKRLSMLLEQSSLKWSSSRQLFLRWL